MTEIHLDRVQACGFSSKWMIDPYLQASQLLFCSSSGSLLLLQIQITAE